MMEPAPALGARKNKGLARINAVEYKRRNTKKSLCRNKRRGCATRRFMPGIPWADGLRGNFALPFIDNQT
jgi:hypothetical protein